MGGRLHNRAAPAVAAHHMATLSVCEPLRILPGACARPGAPAPLTKPPLYRRPHLMLRTAPVGSPFADGETEAEQ